MRKPFVITLLALIAASCMMSSCVVTKKKYDTAVSNGRKSLDSLNRVFNNTVAEFNKTTDMLKSSISEKDLGVNKLTRENQQLAGDKASLNQSLVNSINEFNEEKAKLARKTRTADSLMNLLAMQSAAEDSIRSLDENQQRELQNLLYAVNKSIQGTNQSDAYAQAVGGNIVMTISNDFLFKTATGTDISTKGDAIIKKMAAVLTLNENCRVQVISNTDNDGQAKTLLDLSARRSAAVISLLAANSSLPGSAYTASGRGMYSPLQPNTSADNKKKNRRTEIIIFMR